MYAGQQPGNHTMVQKDNSGLLVTEMIRLHGVAGGCTELH